MTQERYEIMCRKFLNKFHIYARLKYICFIFFLETKNKNVIPINVMKFFQPHKSYKNMAGLYWVLQKGFKRCDAQNKLFSSQQKRETKKPIRNDLQQPCWSQI